MTATVARAPAGVATRSAPDVLWRAVRRRADVLLLAALAYVPTLLSSPGRMPADTKLYLYLDPGRLVSDAPFSWDSRLFGGWVPHQTISYLWPSGPWFWVFDVLGVPVWIAHRLWLGTVLVAGGLGVRWLARHLGLGVAGALVAALCYQLSPYVLPYVSRTSLMLLPWAALGWLIGLTMLAARQGGWRYPALMALVLATVGAPNATAILMIAPGPILWLGHAVAAREITWRRAVAAALRISALAVLTALWWMSMLIVQGRFGADVLGYSESLEAVSATARAPETIRGMGYWLAYVRDPFAATTTAALDHMSSAALILTGFALVTAGFAGLAITRWSARRFAALLVLAGTVLAVGVYPIDDPSPLMSALASNSRSAAALALRSSTRALPLSTLGLALGAGALVVSLGDRLRRRRSGSPWIGAIPALLVGTLAVVNLNIVWTAGFVDPALTRDEQPPDAWFDAASALDALPDGYRVLQLPGTEFGAFRWGYTVDPPLPGLTDRPVVTRDLLPLGSPSMMDALFALDDRFQEGTAEAESIAPLARLLGADVVALTGDVAFDRFRTPRPELTSARFRTGVPGLGIPVSYGEPEPNLPDVPMVDETALASPLVGRPVAPIELVPVEDPQPVVRATARSVLLSGSGDGLVDAAAARLIDGSEAIRASAALPPDEVQRAAADASLSIVTDSNRRRAHQWRGSQDVVGFTEDDDPSTPDLLRPDPADQRLPVFAEDRDEAATVALQRGPVQARATAYGEPFAYRPEDRAVMAIDGDLATAWLVADRADPTRDAIEVTVGEPIGSIELVQPLDPSTNRWITSLAISVDGGEPVPVTLDEFSRTPEGQVVILPRSGRTVRLAIAGVGEDRSMLPSGPDAVGFAEIRTGLGPTEEIVRVPTDVLAADSGDGDLAVVLSRLRTSATNRWRSDPEPALVRAVDLTTPRQFDVDVTARLSPRADDAVLAELLGIDGATTSARLTGVPAAGGWAAVDGDPTTAWTTPFAAAIGSTLTIPGVTAAAGQPVTLHQRFDDRHAVITEVAVSGEDGGVRVPVAVPAPGPDGSSTFALPVDVDGPLSLTVTGTNGALTRDRRYGEPTPLPVAVSEVEVEGLEPVALPDRFDTGCRTDLLTIDDAPVGVRMTGSVVDALSGGPVDVDVCSSSSVDLAPGEHLVRSTPGRVTGIDVDRVVLRSSSGDAAVPASGEPEQIDVSVEGDRTKRTATLGPCPDGCWLVFGEGVNAGWSASVDGTDLGDQEQLAGGLNGWLLPPSAEPRTVTFTWTPQRTVTIGLVLSAAGVVLCGVILVLTRGRARPSSAPDRPILAGLARPGRRRTALVLGATAVAMTAVIVEPSAALPVLVAAAIAVVLRRPRLLGLAATGIVALAGLGIARRVAVYHPVPGYEWLGTVTNLHGPVYAAVVVLAAAALPREVGSVDDAVPSRPVHSRSSGASG